MNQPTVPGYTAPPRRGRPWWVWLLAGCAGCAVLGVLGLVIAGVGIANAVKTVSKDLGTVSQASVQQSLGDVPMYPGSTLDENATRGTLVTYRMLEQNMLRKAPGSVFRGVGMMYTNDPAENVIKFYDEELLAAGWIRTQSTNTGIARQQQYQKSGEMVIIQAQDAGGRTMVLIVRGGPEIAKGMKSQQGSPSFSTPGK